MDSDKSIEINWPEESMRLNSNRLSWGNWNPIGGMVGTVAHFWIPNHAVPYFRSHCNQLIYLMKVNDRFVPVSEHGVKEYHQFTASSNAVNIPEIPSEEEQIADCEEGAASSSVDPINVQHDVHFEHEKGTSKEVSIDLENENEGESTM